MSLAKIGTRDSCQSGFGIGPVALNDPIVSGHFTKASEENRGDTNEANHGAFDPNILRCLGIARKCKPRQVICHQVVGRKSASRNSVCAC